MLVQVTRIPRWIFVVAMVGIPVAAFVSGSLGALGFAVGVTASWWNFRYLQRTVAALAHAAVSQISPGTARMAAGLFVRFAVLAVGAIVILRYSRISAIALLIGLFAPCFAIFLEILYGLLWSTNTKSG